MSRDTRLNGDDFYDRWHEDGDEAFAILRDGCDIPPSLEVFLCGLERVRAAARSQITVKHYARTVVEDYMRVDI